MDTSAPPPPDSSRGQRLSTLVASRQGSPLGRRTRRVFDAAVDRISDPTRALWLLLGVAFVLRVLWLNLPPNSLIFDEVYYVNAARVILGWPVPAGAHYAGSPPGLDPNLGHPPLGKLLIAGSMAVFGDNGIGWRLPDVIAGMIALYMVYRIVRDTDRSGWLAILVVFLVAFDNLTFVHGRIGTLDMLVLAPMLAGSWLALRQRWILAAIAIGIALLIKFTAIYAIGAIGLFVLLDRGPDWWRRKRIPLADVVGPVAFVLFTLAFALGGLGLLDARFKPMFGSPFDHIRQMLTYGVNLDTPVRVGFCPGVDSKPWQWLFNECQITYLRNDVTVRVAGQLVSTHPSIDFRGAMNPILVGAIPIATLFTLWYAWRTRSRAAVWAIAWGAANYLPYLILAILSPRIMYLYYMVPVIPAISVGIALLVTRAGLPRPVRLAFLAAYLVGFAAYFPFRQVP
ncbi:MAG TPA: glycosyltransferase family 39 protein [Candidatus Limnocylindrales bacterium]|nr:glycosyltransferase family 39 protein [Candidatus Limnocylindrales bacterium]